MCKGAEEPGSEAAADLPMSGCCFMYAALEVMLWIWVAAYQRCFRYSKVQVHAHQSSQSSSECEGQGDHGKNLHAHTMSRWGVVFQTSVLSLGRIAWCITAQPICIL